jgi:SAM-dependent methyltransferase
VAAADAFAMNERPAGPSFAAAYDVFAAIYDRHWQRFSIEPFPILDRLLLQRLAPGAPILDLCCGTGQIARQLIARGFQVTGLDSSAGMLAFAQHHAPGAHLVLADARDFNLPAPVDAIVSVSDSLSHITEPAGLAAAFRCALAALRPGGWLLFDLNTEAKYRVRWTGNFGIVEPDQACIVGATYAAETKLARFDATVFLPAGGSWQRTDFAIESRYYSPPELESALIGAGFRSVEFFDWQRDLDPAGEPDKFFTLARA